eukprot:5257801-Pleurochrysis_carterae.AAC.2
MRDRMLRVARVCKGLWDRDVVARLAVNRLIVPKPAGAFVGVETIVALRRVCVFVVVRGSLVFGEQRFPG